MSYTAICTILAVERNEDATTVVKRAWIDYGKEFGNVFNYRKGSNRFIVLQDNAAIAKKVALLKKAGTYCPST
jgi:hypothetical protein